jgi:YD repeat-containing protein
MSTSLLYPTIQGITLHNLFTAKLRRAAGLIIVLMLLSTIIAHGQRTTSPTDNSTPLALTPGAPTGSLMEEFANVNLFNGNLNFALPLATVGGRGGLRIPMTLSIERHWKIIRRCDPTITGGTICHQIPTSMWWGELQVGYGPGILQGRGGAEYELQSNGVRVCSKGGGVALTFTDSSGTEHHLPDQLSNGAPNQGCVGDRGTVFTSVDGTAMTFISDARINDDPARSDGPHLRPNGYLMLSDGTRYRIDNGLVTWIRDRNGNRIDYTYDTNHRVKTITDSLNRQVTINYDVTEALYGLHDQIILPGINEAKRIVRVSKAPLKSALRSDQSLKTYGQLFESAPNGDTLFNPTVITSVLLPNNQSFNFNYSSYGELARIKLPSGGAVEYDFTGGLTNGPVSGLILNRQHIYRRVIAKRIFMDSTSPGSLVSKTTYTKPEAADTQFNIYTTGFVQVDTSDGSDSLLESAKHYFHGAAASSFMSGHPSAPWKDGKEYQTEIFDRDGLTVIRRITRLWQQRAPVKWWKDYIEVNRRFTLDDEPANDPRLTEINVVLEPTGANLVTRQKFNYDEHNNQTDIYNYDYGTTTTPPRPIRHIHTDYLTVNPTNNINYAGPANGTSYTSNDLHIRRMPRSQQIYSINPTSEAETPVGQDETRYDEHPLLDCDGIGCGGAVRWDNPGTARANATSVRRWLNTNNTWVENRTDYDQLGNVRKTWDGRTNKPEAERVTQIEYSATYHHAYPTHTISPVPDPSNINGTDIPMESWTTYDLSTGKMTSTTDSNGKMTKLRYDETGAPDVLDRLRKVESSDGGWVEYFYNDTVGDLYVRTRTAMNASQSVESYQFFDGLGRAVRSHLNEGGSPAKFITADTQYDAMGRIWRVSNTYRTNSLADPVNPSGLWTTKDYDMLGRVKTITAPDGSQIVTAYNGNQATVTDQAGKQRSSISDALGRVMQVVEAPNGPGFNYQTSYEYDMLGNLTAVVQGAQKRTFVYDSLSRLTFAFNPESGAVNYHYDANSNLDWKTDARGVKISYEYDALNRVKTRTYSLTGATPPNYVASPNVFYFYDGKGMPINVPTPSFSKGKLTATKTSVSETIYTEFDAHGNIKKHRQVSDPGTFKEQTYLMEYDYNLAGGLTWQKYPSGKIVETVYDGAGRIAGVKNPTGQYYAGAGLTPADEANRIQYTAHGSVSDLRLGNGLWEHTVFNHRLQPVEIGLGTQKSSNDRLKLVYGYGTNNNGNIQDQTITVPTINGVTGVTLTQTYAYDQLNRLQSVSESGSANNWTQSYTYQNPDGTGGQFGNRRVDPLKTTESLVPASNPTFNMDNNRFATSQGYDYDDVGNLKTAPGFSYSYDSENRMISANDGQSPGDSTYSYDGNGRRVK